MSLSHLHLDVDLFRTRSEADRIRSQRAMLWLLEALTQVNVKHFQSGSRIPRLYQSTIVYDNENMESEAEHWRDAPTTARLGRAVCATLACYRAGELWALDRIFAHPFIRWRELPNRSYRYHALVRWPDGRIEDPSIALGMGGREILRRPIFVT